MTKPNQAPSAPNNASNSPREAQATATRKGAKHVLTPSSPFPQAIYGALALGATIGVAGLVWDKAETMGNYDSRDMVTISDELWNTREIVTPTKTGEITQDKIDRSVESGTCILERMGILPTKEPPNGISRDIWESNNKTRGKSLRVRFGSDKEVTYSYQDNLHGYILDSRWDDAINYMWRYSRHPKYKYQLGWVMESYKAKYPEKNANSWKEIKETWTEHVVEEYLGQPLECPRWVDGSCMKTFEGLTKEDFDKLREALKDASKAKKADKMEAYEEHMETVMEIRSMGRKCLLSSRAAQTVTLANQMMVSDDKGEIMPMTCYRGKESQAVMLSIIAPQEIAGINGNVCKLVETTKADVQNPGGSNHGMALAMDVYNWNEAAPYLSIAGGWLCNFVGNKLGVFTVLTGVGHGSDQGHCSQIEKAPDAAVLAYKEAVEVKIKGGGILDMAKDAWKNKDALK